MLNEWGRLLKRLSSEDLKRLLSARAAIDELESRRESLQKELATIEKKLSQLVSEEAGPKRRRPERVAKKAASAKTTTRKNARRAKPKKTAAKKVKPAAAKGGKRKTLEDVVVSILKKHGEPMPFKDLHEAVVTGKHFETRSKNFENVLRRTLSSSQHVKRKGWGVYGL